MLLSGQVSGQQAKEEVSQLVRGLGAVLEEKRTSLLQAIEECQQERLARLSAQLQEHRSLLDGSGLVGYAQEVLKETDQPCFVQAAKQLHNRYSQGHRGWSQPLRQYLRAHRMESRAPRVFSRRGPHPACPRGSRRGPEQAGRAGAEGGEAAQMAVPDPCLPHPRIARATEALQMFRPAASSSFRHCQLDVGREMKLLTELNFLRGKEPARPCVRLEPSSLLPQQRAGGQRPPGTSRPPARPGQPPLAPSAPATLSHRAQRRFSLSLFVGVATADSAPEHPRQVSAPPRGPAPRRAPRPAPPRSSATHSASFTVPP